MDLHMVFVLFWFSDIHLQKESRMINWPVISEIRKTNKSHSFWAFKCFKGTQRKNLTKKRVQRKVIFLKKKKSSKNINWLTKNKTTNTVHRHPNIITEKQFKEQFLSQRTYVTLIYFLFKFIFLLNYVISAVSL